MAFAGAGSELKHHVPAVPIQCRICLHKSSRSKVELLHCHVEVLGRPALHSFKYTQSLARPSRTQVEGSGDARPAEGGERRKAVQAKEEGQAGAQSPGRKPCKKRQSSRSKRPAPMSRAS